MASAYIAELMLQQPAGPYQIGGWSSGAQIAYEIAQQLIAGGDEVSLLALLDGAALCRRFCWERQEGLLAIWEQQYLNEQIAALGMQHEISQLPFHEQAVLIWNRPLSNGFRQI